MKNLMRVMAVVGATALMTACSGGGTSSGYGTPHASPYAGVYEGKLTATVYVEGRSVTDSVPYRVTVANDGSVSDAVLVSVDASCSGPGGRAYLNGNILDVTAELSCYSAVTGSCRVPANIRVVFNETSGSVEFAAQYYCEAGNFRGVGTAYLRKV